MAELTNLEKVRKLPWQLAGNAFNTVFFYTTVSGSIFVLFLNELGIGKSKIGFLLSLLPFCGLTAIFTARWVAHVGLKRIFLLFYGIRKLCIACLLFTPLILGKFGNNAAFLWVASCIFCFSICRAIAETAVYPWMQECIPDNIRGKFSSYTNILAQLCAIIAIAISGFIIGHFSGLNKFMYIISGGVLCGLLSLWCFFFVPGGGPVPDSNPDDSQFKEIFVSLQDLNFCKFIIGLGCILISYSALISFMPLYMKDKIGLSSGHVVWLDIGTYLGILVSCFFWGWCSDRFGSKPVMLLGAFLMLPIPLFCFLFPRDLSVSAASQLAIIISFLLGISSTAWNIGMMRYLFVDAVPPQKKTSYMAIFYASAGLFGGIAPLAAGALLDATEKIHAKFWFFTMDQYTPFFLFITLIFFIGIFFISKTRSGGALPMKRFMGIFTQGNPLAAVGGLIRYHYMPEEKNRVSITKKLGNANNPLSSRELIEALTDPSFDVRYEAIIAIANSKSAPEFEEALIQILNKEEPDLSFNAAWALGCTGGEAAIQALRHTLHSRYPSLRAKSARSLASLGDKKSIPLFIEYFLKEKSPGLKIAYAQSLGKLKCDKIIHEMLNFLAALKDPVIQSEMALALSRIVDKEENFISIWRKFQTEYDISALKMMESLKRQTKNTCYKNPDLRKIAEDACIAFSKEDNTLAIQLLGKFCGCLADSNSPLCALLKECQKRLNEFKTTRIEYIVLAFQCAEKKLDLIQANSLQDKKTTTPAPDIQ
ncbi:MAG: MFS transporter [Lentisphaeria bacterium]